MATKGFFNPGNDDQVAQVQRVHITATGRHAKHGGRWLWGATCGQACPDCGNPCTEDADPDKHGGWHDCGKHFW